MLTLSSIKTLKFQVVIKSLKFELVIKSGCVNQNM